MLLIFGLGFLLTRNKTQSDEVQVNTEIKGIEVSPASYDLGDVPINGGLVEKEYEIKNVTAKKIILKKIATSCMCTTASFRLGEKETKYFGMEMHTDKNPAVNVEIEAGQVGKVIARFDPAAHGPQGTGPFDRVIYLTFSDPGGIKELKFNGTVTSN